MAIFAGTLTFLWSFNPLSRPVLLDPATWDYMSIALLNGRIPYRDIFLHKTPGAAFVGALGAAVGPRWGLPAAIGSHLPFLLLGAAAPALLFSLCRRRQSLPVALTAAALLVAFQQWPLAALEGARPKVATVAFGLACLLAAERRSWIAAGCWGACSALCWQPGLVFAAGAIYPAARSDRAPRHVLMFFCGMALVGLAFLVWLLATSSLQPFFEQAIGFNLHYVSSQIRTPAGTLRRLWRLLAFWNRELLLLSLSVPLVWLLRLGGRDRRPRPNLLPPGLSVSGLLYLALVFVSLQAWPDTILLGPAWAALIAASLGEACSRAPRRSRTTLIWALPVLACCLALTTSSDRFRPPLGFAEQALAFRAVGGRLAESDSILAIGVPEVLIHSGRPNRWPWLYMWFGVDRFAAEHTPGGFSELLEQLERRPPARMFLARRWHGPYRKQFERWAATSYRRRTVEIFPHTRRPLLVYDRIKTRP